ncbi:Paf1 complex component [Microbotryomycetes sp. JL201]|nr:Paf1 complex component [Microbotryomycetes sp. JL201]
MDADTYPTESLVTDDEQAFGSAHRGESVVPAVASSALELPAGGERDDGEDEDDDLFGDNDMDEDVDAVAPAALEGDHMTHEDDGLTEEERQRRRELEYDEGDAPALQETTQIAHVELASQSVPRGAQVWHARLPNFLSLERNPLTEAWQPHRQPKRPLDDAPTHMTADVPDENVIRWRWRDGEPSQPPHRESNARIVRWSDGSHSLQLGTELFDITLAVDRSASKATGSGPVPAAQPSLTKTTNASNLAHSLTFLTAQHEYTELIEAQASVIGTMSFRPTTLQSTTHRRLAGSIAARNVKDRAVRRLDIPSADPERLKAEREKAEIDKVKRARRQNTQRTSTSRRKSARGETRMVGAEGDDDEDDMDDQHDSFRHSRAHADFADEDDNFIVDDDAIDSGAEDFDEVDRAEDRLAQSARRRSSPKGTQAAQEPTPAPRRRLVVDDSDEE